MTRKVFLLVWVMMVFSMGCQTTKNKESRQKSETQEKEKEKSPPKPDPCKLSPPQCPTSVSPTLCTVSSYDGKQTLRYYAFKGWGANDCLARYLLTESVCSQKKNPEKLGEISCMPDPSDGECPVYEVICSDESEPTECFSDSYGGQPLSTELTIKAWGSNSCKARFALLQQACQLHLKPGKLRNIQCKASITDNECPVSNDLCELPFEPYNCSAGKINDRLLNKPIAASGANKCIARAELSALACSYGIRPSLLGGIECKPSSDP